MNQGTEDGGIPLGSKQTETSGLKLPARFRISGNLSTVLSIVWLFFFELPLTSTDRYNDS